MEPIYIKDTKRTPEVSFDNEKKELQLRGRSIPDNAYDFYKPLFEWIKTYSANKPQETNFHINLEYCNTASSKCVVEMLKSFKYLNSKNILNLHLYFHEEEEEAQSDFEDDLITDYKDYTKSLKCDVKLIVHVHDEEKVIERKSLKL